MSEKLKCKIIKNEAGDIHYCEISETPPSIGQLKLEPDGEGVYRPTWGGDAIYQIWIVFHQADLTDWTIEFGLDMDVHPVNISNPEYHGTGAPDACVMTSTETKFSVTVSNLASNGNQGYWDLAGTTGAPPAQLRIHVKRSGSALVCP